MCFNPLHIIVLRLFLQGLAFFFTSSVPLQMPTSYVLEATHVCTPSDSHHLGSVVSLRGSEAEPDVLSRVETGPFRTNFR